MSNQNRTQLYELMSHIEELWGHLETLFEDLNASGGWGANTAPIGPLPMCPTTWLTATGIL